MNRNLIRRTDAPFTVWQRGLIFEPRRHGKWEEAPAEVTGPIRERQNELIEAVADGPTELVRYLRSRLGLESDQKIEAPPFPRRELTPSEYKAPPVELEEELGAAWKDALEHRAALASSPLFWLLCHIVWIQEGRLGADGLAIEEALLSGTDAREARIRNFLRRTGGLPHVRGNTSVFSDCPLARAWWRFHLADEVSRTTEGRIEAGAAHLLFHLHRPSWERLVMLSLKRVTTINQPSARAAIAYHLEERRRTNGRFDQKDVEAIATGLARVSLRRSLDHTPLDELYEMAVARRPMDLKVLDSISRKKARKNEGAKVKPQTRNVDAPLGEGIEMLQQESGRKVSDSGWHLTDNLAPKLVALIEENGTPSQKRVFKPESGLALREAHNLIKEVWEKKHGKAMDLTFIPGFPPASKKPPQGKGWTLSRVRLPIEVLDCH